MDIKENAVMLLAKTNLNDAQIARALGCTAAYISQIKDEDAIQDQIQDLKAEQAISGLLRQERLEQISNRGLEALESALQSSMNMRPYEAAKVVQIIENLPGRQLSQEKPGGKAEGVQNVIINLPANYKNPHISIELNTNNEIVEINGREMRSMDSRTLLQKLDVHKAQRELPEFSLQLNQD